MKYFTPACKQFPALFSQKTTLWSDTTPPPVSPPSPPPKNRTLKTICTPVPIFLEEKRDYPNPADAKWLATQLTIRAWVPAPSSNRLLPYSSPAPRHPAQAGGHLPDPYIPLTAPRAPGGNPTAVYLLPGSPAVCVGAEGGERGPSPRPVGSSRRWGLLFPFHCLQAAVMVVVRQPHVRAGLPSPPGTLLRQLRSQQTVTNFFFFFFSIFLPCFFFLYHRQLPIAAAEARFCSWGGGVPPRWRCQKEPLGDTSCLLAFSRGCLDSLVMLCVTLSYFVAQTWTYWCSPISLPSFYLQTHHVRSSPDGVFGGCLACGCSRSAVFAICQCVGLSASLTHRCWTQSSSKPHGQYRIRHKHFNAVACWLTYLKIHGQIEQSTSLGSLQSNQKSQAPWDCRGRFSFLVKVHRKHIC